MLTIYTETIINASVTAVWQVLTDFPSYAEWNPYIVSLSHLAQAEESFKMSVIMPNGQKSEVTPIMEIVQSPNNLQWRGRIVHDLVFVGHHQFVLEKVNEQTTRFIHKETFSGFLLPLLKKRVSNQAGFEAMNKAIKQETERRNPRP